MDLRENKKDDVVIFDNKAYRAGKQPLSTEKSEKKNRWKNRNLWASMEFAVTGIFTAFKEERNMKKHALSALLVVLAALVFQVSATEWLFLLLCIFLVIGMEIVNSAIENVVDLASDYSYSTRAKNAKDMAAGAVLVLSVFAVLVGSIIFIPKIWGLIF